MLRTLFFGTGEIAVPTLKALHSWQAAGIVELLGVVTQPDKPAGRKKELLAPMTKTVALELGIPVFQPDKARSPDFLEQARQLAPDLIVVMAYGQILPRTLLDLPPRGCINLHASILPRHRGASPIQAAILAGDTESGITVMHMAEGLDTGDIILVEKTTLATDETGASLHNRLAALAPHALERALPLLANGTASRTPQDPTLSTHCGKLTREAGRIDWSQSAEQIDRQVRAFTPWPGTHTLLPDGKVLKVHAGAVEQTPISDTAAATVLAADSHGILVGTGKGAYRVTVVQPENGKRMQASEYLRGRPLATGRRLDA